MFIIYLLISKTKNIYLPVSHYIIKIKYIFTNLYTENILCWNIRYIYLKIIVN